MAKLIIGIVLLAAPFLLAGFFRDKKRGFVYILFFLIVFHTFLAFFTQFFGVFYYRAILGVNLLIFLVLLFSLGNKLFLRLSGTACPEACKKFIASLNKIDWVFFAVAIISVITLYQVHYNYTGKFSMTNDALFEYHDAKNMKYVYPYFSDEWYAVSLVKESINSHSLPLKNPFDSSFFVNPEIFFHSFIAEIMLFLGLDPLTQYTALSIIINTLIILLAYLFLRLNGVSGFASAISSLSILYITSGANLPGIWNLIPVTMGIALSLIGFCFLSIDDFKMASLTFLFVLLFYPPLLIFSGTGLAVYFFSSDRNTKKSSKIINFLVISALATLFLGIIFLFFSQAAFVKYIFSNLFFNSFTGDFMPQFIFYNIIPWPVIILAVFGLYFVAKEKKWFFYQFALGIFFWFLYTVSNYRIIIGYEKIVFFTSILFTLISGFGLAEIEKYASQKFKNIGPVFKYAKIGAIVLFLLIVPFYTHGENWEKLVLKNFLTQENSIPKAPANNYLTDEDSRIFKNIRYKKFFSIPWKGTVIGTATDNYPVVTKGGTITMNSKNPIIYQQFMSFDCNKKTQIAKEKNIDYIYSTPFLCDNFQETDKSSEGFVLYLFLPHYK